MLLKFLPKIIFFSFFIPFCPTLQLSANSETQAATSKANKLQTNHTQEFLATKITAQRIILQSIAETLWNYFKEEFPEIAKVPAMNDNDEKYILNLTDFGKILSNLMIDEIIPTPKQNIHQKIAELLIPTAVAFIVTKMILSSKDKNYLKLSQNLGLQLLCKLVMVRWFLKPGTSEYNIANSIACFGSLYKHDAEGTNISFKHGIIKLIQDQIKVLVDSTDLGKKLNKFHRKKAIRKILQTLIEPYALWLLDKTCLPH